MAVNPNTELSAIWGEAEKVWAELQKGDYSKIDWTKIWEFLQKIGPLLPTILASLAAPSRIKVRGCENTGWPTALETNTR